MNDSVIDDDSLYNNTCFFLRSNVGLFKIKSSRGYDVLMDFILSSLFFYRYGICDNNGITDHVYDVVSGAVMDMKVELNV